MVSTRFANLLIDSADLLAEARTAEETWAATVRIGRRIGALEVNCGAIMRDTRDLAWLRSSMDARWLDHYHEAKFFEVDPILAACKSGVPRQFVDVSRKLAAGDVPRGRAMLSTMLEFDYRYILTQSWAQGEVERTIVLACDSDPADLYGPGTARAFAAVSAMLCDAVAPPGEALAQEWVCGSPWAQLNARERDVLGFLAHGLAVHEVAARFVMTWEETAHHLSNACRKLGVSTAEQALSLAMARGILTL